MSIYKESEEKRDAFKRRAECVGRGWVGNKKGRSAKEEKPKETQCQKLLSI